MGSGKKFEHAILAIHETLNKAERQLARPGRTLGRDLGSTVTWRSSGATRGARPLDDAGRVRFPPWADRRRATGGQRSRPSTATPRGRVGAEKIVEGLRRPENRASLTLPQAARGVDCHRQQHSPAFEDVSRLVPRRVGPESEPQARTPELAQSSSCSTRPEVAPVNSAPCSPVRMPAEAKASTWWMKAPSWWTATWV